MKKYLLILILPAIVLALTSCSTKQATDTRTISNEVLKDKIAGGWAGKMIGVTYGAPTEFRAQGKTYEDSIKWVPSDVKGSIWQDDIYVQLTFLMTMDRYGMDAPAKKYQELFAKAGYHLWHANVQARKNYFDSIFPPQSGHPDYNLHADDIDFQIEADYIGFMCPGMPQTANKIADKIGHIMNYGDGVYGGVFVAALYAEAYFENDIPKIINKALLSIPAESDYAKAVQDVILLHKQYPSDWRAAWAELEGKWGKVQICGAGTTFNIDAKLNGAYIVMGLLYGEGDPVKTMEVSTRCGQDSDCNPSNAMAVLGVIKGLSGLPQEYQEEVKAIGDSLFINTTYSFNKAVDNTMEYARKLAVENGGEATETELKVNIQQPQPFALEIAFPKLVFDSKSGVFDKEGWEMKGNWNSYSYINPWSKKEHKDQARFSGTAGDEISFTFNGTGVSLSGNWFKDGGRADIFVDGQFKRTVDCYFNFSNQQHENMSIYHITNLPEGKHTIKLVVKGEKRTESEGTNVYISEAVVFKTADKINEKYKFSFQR
ncbi:MAG: ADP-ribosylglycohydrolase family protein [Bacteroidota bacterium]|nr:ADP-ribosylglycohydrolase family protein [Bacteroidota bacterium]